MKKQRKKKNNAQNADKEIKVNKNVFIFTLDSFLLYSERPFEGKWKTVTKTNNNHRAMVQFSVGGWHRQWANLFRQLCACVTCVQKFNLVFFPLCRKHFMRLNLFSWEIDTDMEKNLESALNSNLFANISSAILLSLCLCFTISVLVICRCWICLFVCLFVVSI